MGCLTLIAVGIVFGLGIADVALAARAVFTPPSCALQMFKDIHCAAMLSGRDPDATVRKAELLCTSAARTHSLSSLGYARLIVGAL